MLSSNLLSVWLVPQKEDEKYLSEIVNNLANDYISPIFIPHLTLFGDTNAGFEELKKAIDEVFENIKPFKIKMTSVSQSELFFKTVFVEFKKDNLLTSFFENLAKETGEKKDINIFKPHISLIYKLMSQEEKIKIIEKLNIKSEFIIDKVFINAPGLGQKDFLDVKSWRTLYKKELNH